MNKNELVEYANKKGIDATGTLDEVWKSVKDYLDAHPEALADGPLETFANATDRLSRSPTTLTVPTIIPPNRAGAHPSEPPIDHVKVMNQIRKWGCHFDGRDPISFIERVKDLQTAYGYTDAHLLKGLPEMLRGDAVLWHRNNRDDWRDWEDFIRALRTQYLPRRYQATLRREVADRRQKPGELFAKYATDLLTLMRRAGGFIRDEQIERLYDNMHPEYKIYVRYDEATSVAELQSRAAEYEEIEQQRREIRKADRPDTTKATVAAAYNRGECYWQCKQRGHTRFNCKRPPRKFCFQCGHDEVLTKEYHPSAENAERTEATAANIEPSSSA